MHNVIEKPRAAELAEAMPAEAKKMGEHGAFDLPTFKTMMSAMPAAVTVITCWSDDGQPVGATLSAVSSLSLSPPLMLACFDRGSKTLDTMGRRGKQFLIHLLADGQQNVAGLFAGKKPDKFAAIAWERGLLGLPQLPGCMGLIACEVEGLLPGGDHVIVTGGIRSIAFDEHSQALLYHRREIYPVPPRGGAQQ
jgi:flavin reductase (DIM6/NTAB) family NADH-FMN oxidoreductase RutF